MSLQVAEAQNPSCTLPMYPMKTPRSLSVDRLPRLCPYMVQYQYCRAPHALIRDEFNYIACCMAFTRHVATAEHMCKPQSRSDPLTLKARPKNDEGPTPVGPFFFYSS